MLFSNWFHSSSQAPMDGANGTGETTQQNSAPQVFDTVDAQGIGRAGVRDALIIPNATAAHCFTVVSEVNRYPEFLSLYKSVKISSDVSSPDRLHNERIAHYSLNTPLILHAFLKSVDYTLLLVSDYDPRTGVYTMSWTQTEGPSFIIENVGKWTISPQSNNSVEMQLEMNLGYSFYLPTHLKNMIQNHMVKDTLNSLRDRAIQEQTKLRSVS